MRRVTTLVIFGIGAIFFATGGRATTRNGREAAIGKVEAPLALNGWPNGAAWDSAVAIALAQQSPRPGTNTPFTTTVRMLRDRQHIYLEVVCADPDPSRIAVHTRRRDGDQSGDDNVMVVLDPFMQKKLAYVFQVNAGGGMADGLISPGYLDPNTNSPVDYSWNGYWRAMVKRTGTGWIAEIAIDTRSLQFDSQRDSWGFNLSRYVPRNQLTLAWSGINLNAQVTNLQWEGMLDGMHGLDQGSRFEFSPYGVAEYDGGGRQRAAAKAGFDLKYNFTPELAGLFTYHTDFSEAQANSLAATISPYAQSIPETRQFFLDGANIFTFGHNLGQNFIPFYSRSVGLVDGTTVPLNEGVKLLGQMHGWTVGMLDAQMGGSRWSDPTNLFVGRANYNINDHWRVGALVTHGDPLGKSDNTLASFDSLWSTSTFRGDKTLDVSAWGARSWGSALPDGKPIGYGVDVAYPNDLWWMDFNYNYYGSALDPAMGFVQRPGTKQTYLDINWQPRPAADSLFSWVRQFDIYGTVTYVTDLNGRVESEDWKVYPVQFTTQGGWQAYWGVHPSFERLSSAYQIVPDVTIPAGNYRFTYMDVAVATPASNPLALTLEFEQGNLYSGHYKAANPALTWSSRDGKFSASLQPVWIEFSSPQGNGSVRAERLNINYSFTPNLTLSDLVQYDNISHSTSINARLQWYIRPNRILYVVWNHGLALNPNILQGAQIITGNTVVVKLVWGS